MTFELSPALLSGYLLALVRAAAWVAIAPPFGTRMLPLPVKAGLAAALALVLGPGMAEQAVPLEVGPLAGAVVLQVFAGLALGFIAVVIFSVFSAAGSMIDLFSGLTIASVFDPLSGGTSATFGRFYQLLATTLLFAIDGHLLLVRGFLTSFDAAPLTTVSSDAAAELLTRGLGLFFVAALEIAAPLLAALFLTEVALGLLSRAAPQMNVFILGIPLKILLTITLAAAALPMLPGAVSTVVRTAVRSGTALVGG
jgi:flagellar biosynthesis protein FliR